jgi:two-component system response regulator DevR
MRNFSKLVKARAIPDATLRRLLAVLMITSFSDKEAITASIIAGASSYLIKNANRVELLKAVRQVAGGGSLLHPEATQHAIRNMTSLATSTGQIPGEELTEREREVLALVARGYTNKQIAGGLYISEKTARNHVSHILEKLDLSRRSEAAAYAVEHKLITPRE